MNFCSHNFLYISNKTLLFKFYRSSLLYDFIDRSERSEVTNVEIIRCKGRLEVEFLDRNERSEIANVELYPKPVDNITSGAR